MRWIDKMTPSESYSFAFFAPFTPETVSSDIRKSGYLKPDEEFGEVRQAAPSTADSPESEK